MFILAGIQIAFALLLAVLYYFNRDKVTESFVVDFFGSRTVSRRWLYYGAIAMLVVSAVFNIMTLFFGAIATYFQAAVILPFVVLVAGVFLRVTDYRLTLTVLGLAVVLAIGGVAAIWNRMFGMIGILIGLIPAVLVGVYGYTTRALTTRFEKISGYLILLTYLIPVFAAVLNTLMKYVVLSGISYMLLPLGLFINLFVVSLFLIFEMV